MSRRARRRIWGRVHRWAGLGAGVVLAMSGATGALMSFEDEITHALNLNVRTVASEPESRLDPPALLARIRGQEPGRRVLSLDTFSDPERAARVRFAREDSRRGETRWANPYTGRLQPSSGTRGEDFFRATRTLHRFLVLGSLGDRDVGRQITGASTILLALLALSGLYLRWPRTLRGWRGSLGIDLRARGRALLWNQHVVLGTWALPLLLTIALTGLYWSYDGYRSGLYALAGVEAPERERRPTPAEHAVPPFDPDLQSAWAALLRTIPASDIGDVSFRMPRRAGDPLRLSYLDRSPPHSRAFNTLELDPETGELLAHERYAEKSLGGRFMSSMLALHTGSFFGLPGRIAFLLASLALPIVALTGLLLFLREGLRKRRIRQRSATPDVPAQKTPSYEATG